MTAKLPSGFEIDGQRYHLAGTVDHWTRDERYVELVVYEAICAHPGCRRVFRYKTTKTNWRRHQVNRRCEEHKAPCVPVPKKKRANPSRAKRKAVQGPVSVPAVVSAPTASPRAPWPSYLD